MATSRFHLRCLFPIVGYSVLVSQFLAAVASHAAEAQSKPVQVLLDTDPGADDVFALLWLQALARQGLAEIVAVTTVEGNVNAQYTFTNAGQALVLGGFEDVEVGRSVVARSQTEDAAHIHGADGMGNLSSTLPEPRHQLSDARRADQIIIDKLEAAPGEVTLVAVGPLTNLAAAEERSPGILAKAKEIVVMGGAFRQRGNVTSHAEFNIHYDPEAAEKVIASRDDIVVIPLDVTQQITLTGEHARAMYQSVPDSPVMQLVLKLCAFMTKTSLSYRDTEGVHGFHVHDAATLAYLFYPETLLLRRARIGVETQGRLTRGQTVFDDRHVAKAAANAWVAMKVDAVSLLAIMAEDLKALCMAP